jgi:hypothetical protein
LRPRLAAGLPLLRYKVPACIRFIGRARHGFSNKNEPLPLACDALGEADCVELAGLDERGETPSRRWSPVIGISPEDRVPARDISFRSAGI